MDQYTFVGSTATNVLIAGYENGKKKYKRVAYQPSLYFEADGPFRNVAGRPLRKNTYKNIGEMRNRISSMATTHGIYGFPHQQYVYLYDNFKEMVSAPSEIKALIIDIETDSKNGFPDIQKADKEINAITLKVTRSKTFHVFGLLPYTMKEKELHELVAAGYKVNYYHCVSEYELLRRLLVAWSILEFDVITGWNVEGFDIPYIIKRIAQVVGNDAEKKLSPFGQINRTEIEIYGRVQDRFEIVGYPTLDYLQIYKKFSFKNEESYTLDHICGTVLGSSKLDYSEYGTLAHLYEQNHDKYIDYNIIDVWRVEQLEDFLKFIDQIVMLAHTARVNFIDTFTTVRIWDVLIHNYLMDQGIAVPYKVDTRKQGQIAGGYVKDVVPKKHPHVMSFDVTSLYPHLIMMYNISPETFRGSMPNIATGPESVDRILNGELDDFHDRMISKNVTVTGKGTVFSRDSVGFLPTLMARLFQQRKQFKKQMIQSEGLLQEINAEIERRGL